MPDENITTPEGHAECQKKLDEYLAGWKRALADYQNLKKTVDEGKTLIGGWKDEAWALELLAFADHWAEANKHIPESAKADAWVQGITHIERELLDLLKKHGVERYESVGQPFDPMLHESVKCEKREGSASGVVLEEVVSGYRMNGRVLRPAKVTVAE